ncbi:MAG: ABC transporter ATP-binding protein [Clostridia bacterium]|nr:ABC transporter ATP-binding protein [Clostridia bacterium]
MKKLFVYLKNYKKECVLGPAFKLLEALFELFVPLVMASVIDRGINNADNMHIWKMIGVMILLGVIGLVCSITAQYFCAVAAVGFSGKIRSVLFKHIQSLDFKTADKIGTSTLITRITSDLNQLQNGVNLVLRLFLRSPFIVFGAAIMAFTVDVKASLIFLATIPLLSVIVFAVILGGAPVYKKVQSALDNILKITRENLTGARVIRAFGAEGAEIERFNRGNSTLKSKQLFAGRITALMNPLTYVVVNLSVVYILYSGAIRVNTGNLTQGEVVALVNYMSQILIELVKLANLIITVTKAVACGNRIADVLAIEGGMETAHSTDTVTSAVEFKNVSLSYNENGEKSLDNISFAVTEGMSVGVIGVTGSGKSSLVNLIPRFYDVTEGEVFVMGKNVKSYPVKALRKLIAIVPQKAQLFKGTIRSNVTFGKRDATDEEINRAIAIAQAEDVVLAKGGLDGEVAQMGRNLSGGQRQRLTIARAILTGAKILVLDDSASALDYKTDFSLRRAISKIEGVTTFIVSQRASSVMNCDMIITLEDGTVAGIGTHKELLEKCEVYSEIYYSQYERSGDNE